MPPDNTHAPHRRFPSKTAPNAETAERRLTLLTNWRTGALATTIVTTGLLPFAIAWRLSDLTAIAASIRRLIATNTTAITKVAPTSGYSTPTAAMMSRGASAERRVMDSRGNGKVAGM